MCWLVKRVKRRRDGRPRSGVSGEWMDGWMVNGWRLQPPGALSQVGVEVINWYCMYVGSPDEYVWWAQRMDVGFGREQ